MHAKKEGRGGDNEGEFVTISLTAKGHDQLARGEANSANLVLSRKKGSHPREANGHLRREGQKCQKSTNAKWGEINI
jgi:hypothetical protein